MNQLASFGRISEASTLMPWQTYPSPNTSRPKEIKSPFKIRTSWPVSLALKQATNNNGYQQQIKDPKPLLQQKNISSTNKMQKKMTKASKNKVAKKQTSIFFKNPFPRKHTFWMLVSVRLPPFWLQSNFNFDEPTPKAAQDFFKRLFPGFRLSFRWVKIRWGAKIYLTVGHLPNFLNFCFGLILKSPRILHWQVVNAVFTSFWISKKIIPPPKKNKIVSSFEDQHIFILDLKSNLHQLAVSQLTGTLK